MAKPRRGKLLLCSRGLKPLHITLETVEALKSCALLVSDNLDLRSERELRLRCPGLAIRTMRGGPEEFVPAAMKLALALPRGASFAYMAYGNAGFLCSQSALLAEAAAEAGFQAETLDGVSSVDSLVNLLGLNRFSPAGLRLVNVDACLKSGGKIGLTPDMDTLFFTPWYLGLPEHSASLRAFAAAAAGAYGGKGRACLASSPTLADGRGRTGWFRAGALAARLRRATRDDTLFIPAASASGAGRGRA